MIEPRLVPADQIRTEPPCWLWADRVPCGAITILEGDPGCGKSTLVYDLAARVSTGKRMPASPTAGPPGGVLLFEARKPLPLLVGRKASDGARGPSFLPPIQRGPDPIKERDLRPIAAEPDWQKQRRLWRQLLWRRPNDTAPNGT